MLTNILEMFFVDLTVSQAQGRMASPLARRDRVEDHRLHKRNIKRAKDKYFYRREQQKTNIFTKESKRQEFLPSQ